MKDTNSPKVDVSITAFGKPFMTAVTISSLLRHSGDHIDKIYLTPERVQPYNTNFDFIKKKFGDKVVLYTPSFFFGLASAKKSLLWFTPYRRSLRYQYSLEESKNEYLFIAHNDVLFHQDIIGRYLKEMEKEKYVGVGPIGQCWNCPASYAKYCTDGKYEQYKPQWKEFWQLCNENFAPRKSEYKRFIQDEKVWPLPECRLNEWSALVDLKAIRHLVNKPYKLTPLGQMNLDIGTQWFSELNHLGFRFKNVPLDGLATHVWTGKEGEANSGLDTQNNFQLYQRAEREAYKLLIDEFGYFPEELQLNSLIKP
jgi:hypothetical protein